MLLAMQICVRQTALKRVISCQGLDELADAIEESVATKRADKLTQAVLSKAFRTANCSRSKADREKSPGVISPDAVQRSLTRQAIVHAPSVRKSP
jgi:hypothetical protein